MILMKNAVFCVILNGIRETDRSGAVGRIPSTIERYGRFFCITFTITLIVPFVSNIWHDYKNNVDADENV